MRTRREVLMSTLFGAGYVGLLALATGLPVPFLLDPRKALPQPAGDAPCPTATRPQFIIFNTSGDGDAINTGVPGTYEDARIVHSLFPSMAPRPVTIGGRTYTAAAP